MLAEPQEGFVRIGEAVWLLQQTEYRQVRENGRDRMLAVLFFDAKRRETQVELDGWTWTSNVRAQLEPDGYGIDAIAKGVALRPLATGGVGLDGNFERQDGTRVPFALFVNPNAGVTRFKIDGNVAEMRGRIGRSFVTQLETLLNEHPEVDTLVMADVPGGELTLDMVRAVRRIR